MINFLRSDLFYESLFLPILVSVFASIFASASTILIQKRIEDSQRKKAFRKALLSEVRENFGILKEIQKSLFRESSLNKDIKEVLSFAKVEVECYLALKIRDFVTWEWKKEVWQVESILAASCLDKREYERAQVFFDLVEETKRNIFALDREIQDSFQFCIDVPEIGQIRLAEIDKDKWQSLSQLVDHVIEVSNALTGKGYE